MTAADYDLRLASFDDVDTGDGYDLVLTDPPYVPETDVAVTRFLEDARRWVTPGGSLVAMLGQRQLSYALAALTSSGLTYRWTFAFMNFGAEPRHWPYKLYIGWKPIVWATNGNISSRRRWFADRIRGPRPDKQHHIWGQHVGPFIDMALSFSRRGDIIADPFLGAGTTAVAAALTGRRFIGCDIDPDVLPRAQARVDAALEYRNRGRKTAAETL